MELNIASVGGERDKELMTAGRDGNTSKCRKRFFRGCGVINANLCKHVHVFYVI